MACLFCDEETSRKGGVHFFNADIDISMSFQNGVIRAFSGMTESSKYVDDANSLDGSPIDNCLELEVSYCPWCGEKIEKIEMIEKIESADEGVIKNG